MEEIKYYQLSYVELEQGKIKSTNTLHYYTSAPFDLNEMRDYIKNTVLNNPAAFITFSDIKRLDKRTYIRSGGRLPSN